MRQQDASDYLSVDDTVFLAHLSYKLKRDQSEFKFKLRSESAYGPSLSVNKFDPAYLEIEPPDRFLDLNKSLKKTKNFQSIIDFEQLYYNYHVENLDFSIGRRAIGVGVLKYLPIWNRFVPSLSQVGGPALIHNPDNFQFVFQKNEYSVGGVHVEGFQSIDNMDFAEFTLFSPLVELHLIAGSWWGDHIVGMGLVKDFEGITFRGESLLFENSHISKNKEFQLGGGVEYAFGPKFAVTFESMFSQ
jgi:hypothetical protein